MKKKASRNSSDDLSETVSSLKKYVEDIYEDMVTNESLGKVGTELRKEIIIAKKEQAHHALQTSEQVVFLTQRMTAVEKTQGEILDILRPMQRAQDRDSEAIVSHDHRLIRIERKLSVAK